MRTKIDEFIGSLLKAMPNLDENQISLVRMYSQSNKVEQGIAGFDTDIENVPFSYICLLSRYFSYTGFNNAPGRIQGVHKKLTAENVFYMAETFRLMSSFNKEGLYTMPILNTALKVYALPETVQKIDEIQFAADVSEQAQYEKVLLDSGYIFKAMFQDTYTYQKDMYTVKLYFRVLKASKDHSSSFELLKKNGKLSSKNETDYLALQPEDNFLMLMLEGTDIFIKRDKKSGPCLWITNCIDLSRHYELDYSLIVHHAEQYGVKNRFQLALQIMKKILPDYFGVLYEYSQPDIISQRLCDDVIKRIRIIDSSDKRMSRLSSIISRINTVAYTEHCLGRPEDDFSFAKTKAAFRLLKRKLFNNIYN